MQDETDGDDARTSRETLTARWHEFLELPYPPADAGAPARSPALTVLNATVRVGVDTLLETRRLDAERIAALGLAHGELTRLVPATDAGHHRRYMERLNELARLALEVLAATRPEGR